MVLQKIKKELLDLLRFRWLVKTTVEANLKLRYRRSILGFFWSLLGPTLNYGTLAFVFYFGLKPTSGNYLLFVLPGILVFTFVANSLPNSASAFIANEMYIKKIYVPKSVFVVNACLSDFVNFLLAFFSLVSLGLLTSVASIHWSYLLLPIFLLFLFVFILGLGLILSIVTVFFRDVQHVIPILTQALFYLTPILYEPELLPDFLRPIQTYNPLYLFVRVLRLILTGGSSPYDGNGLWNQMLLMLSYTGGLALVTFLAGMIALKSFDNRIVFRL